MKTIGLFLFSLFILVNVNAQKKQNTYYLKDNGKHVDNIDSADYFRIIEEPDSGEVNFVVKEFYKTKVKKSIGKVLSFNGSLVYEGEKTEFYPNGISENIYTYKKNSPVGKAFFYFRDGQLCREIEYVSDEEAKVEGPRQGFGKEYRLVYEADSLGQVFIKDGQGHLIERSSANKDSLVVEGNYKDGFKDGTWTGKYLQGDSSYTEIYADKKFVSGVRIANGVKKEYAILESLPQYKGGISQFYKFLGKKIQYPSSDIKRKIMGTVVISFTVGKDGTIADAFISQSVSPTIDKEALRVMMLSPKWIPGMVRGLPVKVKYNIPLKFSL